MRKIRKIRRLKRYGAILIAGLLFVSCQGHAAPSNTAGSVMDSVIEEFDQTRGTVVQTSEVAEAPETVEGKVEITPIDASGSSASGSDITVTFIDVGQGDSILIQDNGQNMLIDTGYYSQYDDLTATLSDMGADAIDVLVCTHPDADHIGSAGNIVSYYGVNTVYMPDFSKDSKAYGYLVDAINTFGVPVAHPTSGELIPFGTATYEVIGPVAGASYEDANSHSIMIKMTNGEDTFLFTGDATGEETEDILRSGADVSAKVYKAAHHGSANDGCNSAEFVMAVNPETAVISCGYQNDYGHPHVETMQLFQAMNCNLVRTDVQGTITCHSSGNGITWSVPYTDDYRNGNSMF